MKQACSVAGVLMMTLLALVSGAEAEPRPVLEVDKKILDFGDLPINHVEEGIFTVRNTGNATLEIREIRPTCGCTVAEFDRTIPPGGTGRIKGVLDTTGYLGPVSWALMVFSNDPETPQVNLMIRANIRMFIDVLPRPLLRFNALKGETITDKVTLVAEDGSDFRVLGVEGDGNGLKTSVRELRGGDRIADRAGSQWELVVTVLADANEGMLTRRLKVQTTSPRAPEVTVNVSGIVRPIVQVIPAELNFGEVSSAHPIGRNVVLINNRAENELKILGAEVDSPVFSAKANQMGTSQRFQVGVTLKPGTRAGEHRGVLKVKTNDPNRSVIEVPVRAVVR